MSKVRKLSNSNLGVIIAVIVTVLAVVFNSLIINHLTSNSISDKTITIYSANGDIIATYNGKIKIYDENNDSIEFEYDGKRYIYYNCTIETINNIN